MTWNKAKEIILARKEEEFLTKASGQAEKVTPTPPPRFSERGNFFRKRLLFLLY